MQFKRRLALLSAGPPPDEPAGAFYVYGVSALPTIPAAVWVNRSSRLGGRQRRGIDVPNCALDSGASLMAGLASVGILAGFLRTHENLAAVDTDVCPLAIGTPGTQSHPNVTACNDLSDDLVRF